MSNSQIRLAPELGELLALGPLACRVAGDDPAGLTETVAGGGAPLRSLILRHDLAAWWHMAIGEGPAEAFGTDAPAFRHARAIAAASYMAQRHALAEVGSALDGAGVAYAVFKGAALRERLFSDPSVLPSYDVDILVAPEQRAAAVTALTRAGFGLEVDPRTATHEVLLRKPHADIDLHWELLRPGRMRRADVSRTLLARRVRCNAGWVLADQDALFVALVHPVFAKRVCSAEVVLARIATFLALERQARVHWPAVVHLLGETGLRTAAWCMLGWYLRFARGEQAAALARWRRELAPGAVRQAYLGFWIRHALPLRWRHQRWLVQLGLLAFAHDGLRDAARAYGRMLAQGPAARVPGDPLRWAGGQP